MKLGVLKKLIQNLPDDAEIEVEQDEKYTCHLLITVTEGEDFHSDKTEISILG